MSLTSAGLLLWSLCIGVDVLVALLDPGGESEAGATEQRDPRRRAFSQTAAPQLRAAVVLEAAASD